MLRPFYWNSRQPLSPMHRCRRHYGHYGGCWRTRCTLTQLHQHRRCALCTPKRGHPLRAMWTRPTLSWWISFSLVRHHSGTKVRAPFRTRFTSGTATIPAGSVAAHVHEHLLSSARHCIRVWAPLSQCQPGILDSRIFPPYSPSRYHQEAWESKRLGEQIR